MAEATPEIILCPPDRRAEALTMVLTDLAPSQRAEVASTLWPGQEADPSSVAGLYIVLRDDKLCGAAWAQRQPGNTAVFWPPQLVPGEDERTAQRLADAVVEDLDRSEVTMAQALVPSQDDDVVPLLQAVGFRHLADLLYLACEAERFPSHPAGGRELQFVPYDESKRDRLMQLIERTYEGTLDCAALNGRRCMADVIAGYQSTGMFRPANWRIVRDGGQDVGVLLLTDHPTARHWELIYMGLVPEARGRGWGWQITQHAQALARAAEVDRIVLAVDAANEPALLMYHTAGFESWDRRTVFVRFSAKCTT